VSYSHGTAVSVYMLYILPLPYGTVSKRSPQQGTVLPHDLLIVVN
jgi:hypothetical protein